MRTPRTLLTLVLALVAIVMLGGCHNGHYAFSVGFADYGHYGHGVKYGYGYKSHHHGHHKHHGGHKGHHGGKHGW